MMRTIVKMPLRSMFLLVLVCLGSCMKSGTRRTRERHSLTVHTVESSVERKVILVCKEDPPLGDIVLNSIWTKNDMTLEQNDRIRIFAENVTIYPILPEDEGMYRCNDSDPYPLTVSPQVIDSDQRYVVHERGLPLQLECGIILGPLSKTMNFKVEWQHVLKTNKFVVISCCLYQEENDGRAVCNCVPEFDTSDFSLSLTDNSYSDDEGQVDFKCRVTLGFQPSSNSDTTNNVNTTVILFDSLPEVMIARPADCQAPVISLNLSTPIPIPRPLLNSSSKPIQLLVEYTRVYLPGENSVNSEHNTINKTYDANALQTSSMLERQLSNPPYMLLSWKAYVVRVRLIVLGKHSRLWSSYSRPFCVDCQDCMNLLSVKLNLRLSFPPDSNLCSYKNEDIIKEEVENDIKTTIQQTCPEYLCQDLTFSDMKFSCSSEDTFGIFSASVSSIGAQENIESFLRSISEQPLKLQINDTEIEVKTLLMTSVMTTPSPIPSSISSPVPSTEADTIAGIAGSSGGAGVAFALLLLALAISYIVWHRKKYRNTNRTQYSSDASSEVAESAQTATKEPVEPRICPPQRPRTSLSLHHNNILHGQHPYNLNSSFSPSSHSGNSRYFNAPLPRQLSTSQNIIQHQFAPTTSFLGSPLTMSQAGQLVSNQQDNITDVSSIHTSTYTPPSEISFMSSTLRVPTPLSLYSKSTGRETPMSLRSSHRSRQHMFLPLSQPTPPSASSVHYHHQGSTPLATPFVSDHFDVPSPHKIHCRSIPSEKTVSLSHSPSTSLACGSQSPFSEQHYRLWTSGTTSPWPRLHLPHRQGVSESPV